MHNCRGTYLNNFYIYGEQREVSKSYWNKYRSQNLKGYGPLSHASSSASNGALRHTYTQVGNVNAYGGNRKKVLLDGRMGYSNGIRSVGQEEQEKWKWMKRTVGLMHEKYVGRCLTKVFKTEEGFKSVDGIVKFVHWFRRYGFLVRVAYHDGNKEDMTVEKLENLLRVVKIGSFFEGELRECAEAEPFDFEWQQNHLFVDSSVFDCALDSEQEVEARLSGYCTTDKFSEPEQRGICFEICGSQEKKEKSVRNHVSVEPFHCGRLQPPGLEKQEQKTDSVLQVLGTNARSRTFRNSESGLSLRKRISHSSLACRTMDCRKACWDFMYDSAAIFIRFTNVFQRCLVFSAFRAWEFLGWDPPGEV